MEFLWNHSKNKKVINNSLLVYRISCNRKDSINTFKSLEATKINLQAFHKANINKSYIFLRGNRKKLLSIILSLTML